MLRKGNAMKRNLWLWTGLAWILWGSTNPALGTDPKESREAAARTLFQKDTRVSDDSRNAFGRALPGTERELWQPFRQGKRFFTRLRVAGVHERQGVLRGLGPLFNEASCAGCHFKDGRGGRGQEEPRLLARLAVRGEEGWGPHPTYGHQLQDRALPGIPTEGRLEVTWQEETGTYADGTLFRLRRPKFEVVESAHGLQRSAAISVRMPPPLLGLGLLEAIPGAHIVAGSDPEDRDQDGISGRVHWVPDLRRKAPAVGRFGWKAGQPTLEQQNSAALALDMGVRNGLYPESVCTQAQEACAQRDLEGSLEATAHEVERLTLYTRLLAVPSRRWVEDPRVLQGERVFTELGCAQCHRPTWVTGDDAELAAVRGRRIEPYTDLLLHDMGDGLADDLQEHQAQGREWRTPPLWGLGLVEKVSGTVRLLHDGRARSVEEAILWHGGEARASREGFRNASASSRQSLLRFLESL